MKALLLVLWALAAYTAYVIVYMLPKLGVLAR